MFWERLFKSIVHHLGSDQPESDEEGLVISRRLRDLQELGESREVDPPLNESRQGNDGGESCSSVTLEHNR